MLGGKVIDLLAPVSGMQIESSRCLHRRFARTGCKACEQVCQVAAVTVDKGPCIETTLCTSCRRCEAACPTGCLQGDDRDLLELAAALARVARPVLGCREPGIQAHVHTGCLGFLEREALLALSLSLPQGLTLNLTRCQGCRNAGIVAGLHAALVEVQRCSGPARGGQLRLAQQMDTLDFQEIDLSRRGFFTFLRTRSADTAQIAVQRLQQTPQTFAGRRKALPARRRLLLQALATLPAEVGQPTAAVLFPETRFTSTCTACTGCIGICPTGAMQPAQEDRQPPIFDRNLCIGCGSCQAFCRKTGVQLVETDAGQQQSAASLTSA